MVIGKLKGSLVEVDGNVGLVETNSGVFYRVYLPPSLLSSPLPSSLEVYTYLQVREDAFVLYGFRSKKEYDFFTLLLAVSGVGPKTAFSIVSFSPIDALLIAVKDNNIEYFSRIPGLGKKTAMKIILELSQKLKTEFKMEQMDLSEEDKTVIEALVSLGFKSQEARQAVSTLSRDLSVEQKITETLRLTTAHKNKK